LKSPNFILLLRKKKHLIKDYFNYSLFDLLGIAIPIITIPLFLEVFGRLEYGNIILARVYSGIAGIFIDFSYKNIGSKNIASIEHKDFYLNTSFTIKSVIFLIVGVIYCFFCFYYLERPFFYFIFYLLNLQTILIPNFFYVGLGKFKSLSKIGFLVSLIQIVLFFTIIKTYDYLILVPLIYLISYIIGGIYSYYELNKINITYFKLTKINKKSVNWHENFNYLKKNTLGIVKDRLSYIIIDLYVGKASILEFDLGLKLVNLLSRPISIYSNILIRKSVKNSENFKFIYNQIKYIAIMSFIIWIISSLFLKIFINSIINEPINVMVIIILSGSSIFLNITSFTNSNGLLVLNKSKYVLIGMVVATVSFLSLMLIMFQIQLTKPLLIVTSAVFFTYLIESFYTVSVLLKLNNNNNNNNNK
jgi:O-antigen/teichoic acid export membrane protein